ncbi:thiamine pyrophosphate-dependent enzyme [Pseudonocardia sp. TRM90224]|uniref:thiamine pyrophosphate-dependent enzyme n=1 Tax=Pseudonocardia sp. TRM90224 TaxID=2812678 RepID=UPI00272E40D0|nr:thiamine pyrophosphate-dependent enzyme [Pseudonocardia sp. TRM90224]
MTTIRDATYAVLRECGMQRLFANPGSTEIAFLADLPDDLEFVLGLHEGSVVGMATGYAIATGRPAFVNLHTTAGFGNAVGAIATARVNRAPLVVVVGQQDRRHLAQEPFLAGRLDGLAGSYPVWTHQPALPQDVPGAIRRAWHEAAERRGPAVVVVPMDDWAAPYDPTLGIPGPVGVRRTGTDPGAAVAELAEFLDRALSPALVVGAGADDQASWDALVALAERVGTPVWQEAFGARAGFPQDHPQFAGHLPPRRSGLREVLGEHDAVLVVGTSAFRQYVYEPGPLLPTGLAVAVVSADPDELHHSHADLAIRAEPATLCAAVAQAVRPRPPASTRRPAAALEPPGPDGPLRPAHVFTALAERLPRDVVLVEESPSSRPELHRLLPARAPRGFVSAAMGGLGFGLPAAAGLRMGDPSRPVVAVLGDGSSLYAIQGLWSAERYACGVLYVVLSNGRYAIMDRLAAEAGGKPPWPGFGEIDMTELARSLNCPARRVATYAELVDVLDDVVPTLATRTRPLLLDVTTAVE